MRDGMEKSQSIFNRKQFIIVCALAGLLLLGGVLGLSAHSDLQNAEKQFEDTISYVKEQCTDYDNLNLATETKSLMRMMENAQHLCSEIARDQQETPGRVLDDAAMEEYLQDYTLSGILVLFRSHPCAFGRGQNFVRCLTGWSGVRPADPGTDGKGAGRFYRAEGGRPPGTGLCRADGKGG